MIFFSPTVANWMVARRFLPEPERETILPGPYSGCLTVMPCLNSSGETRGTSSPADVGRGSAESAAAVVIDAAATPSDGFALPPRADSTTTSSICQSCQG